MALFFYVGLLHNCPFIGTRATNRVDLEYLFYLPFCDALASGDDFHARICGVFLREDQSFVTRDALKADLAAIDSMWARLLPYQKAYIWPPEREGSVVLELWKKHVAPVRTDDQDQSRFLSKEQHDFILAKLRPMIDEARRNASTTADFPTDKQPDFMLFESKMYLGDPCPCGSGRPAGQCCLKGLGGSHKE